MAGSARFAHLVTVGVSVLRNAREAVARGDVSLDPEEARRVEEALAYCVDRARLDDEKCLVEAGPGTRVFSVVEAYLATDPFSASAELNAMKDLFLAYSAGSCERRNLDKAVLYATDTNAGRIAAEALKGFLEGACGVSVEVRRVPGFGVAERLFTGIYNLVRDVKRDVACLRRAGFKVLINATGGFKPETAAMMLAGALSGALTAYYIHESFRRPVVIPLPHLEPMKDYSGVVTGIVQALVERGGGRVKLSELPSSLAWLPYIAETLGFGRVAVEGGEVYLEVDGRRDPAMIVRLAGELARRVEEPGEC